MTAALRSFAESFAAALAQVDAGHPEAIGARSGRKYLPGIGPFAERRAVAMAVDVVRQRGGPTIMLDVPYPDSRQRCDIVIAEPRTMIEVKMARQYGDNGKPDPTAVKDLLSPYPLDRSALTDCTKLGALVEPGVLDAGILIYGFESDERPLDPLIDAFETLASQRVRLSERAEFPFGPLVHPVHSRGRVFLWSIHEQQSG